MAPRLDYGMIYGVGIWPLRKPFRVYLVLHVQRMLLLQIMWNFMEVPFSGT
jgi:hypothetical protein